MTLAGPPLVATYRIQVTPADPLDDVIALLPRLAALGVSHVYTSPLLQATPGSTHGYDVTDHAVINPELGGARALDRLHAELERLGMGHVLDIVPNHMAVGHPANRWWWDVLKHGPESRFARHFDIDWDPDVTPSGEQQVLVPVLGTDTPRSSNGTRSRWRPWATTSWSATTTTSSRSVPRRIGSPPIAAGELPASTTSWIVSTTACVVADRGPRNSTTPLLRRHHARRTASRSPDVFADVHRLALDGVRRGRVHGLRVDHPDGLRNPRAYFDRLAGAAPSTWIVGEKILEHGEELRRDWSVHGTTGYDFATEVTGVLIDPSVRRPSTGSGPR
ncbi:MAG: alpha-amylase family glycosyl hydrolase [Ilumatobacteraceae bacterium]